jgi:Nucleotide modification associated domain 3
MRIIFSRKGVDSASGRCASPLVDGRPYSLPIPSETMPSPTRYGHLSKLLQALAKDLSDGELAGDRLCHLDPDIDPDALAGRRPGWRGAFGQASRALSHLENQGVVEDDLFLFWGLFREAARRQGMWRYVGPRRNLIFGWLQVESIVKPETDCSDLLARYPWLSQHPHVRPGWRTKNAIFLAREVLSFGNGSLPGYGVFRRPFMLTAENAKGPSEWSVPPWLDPQRGGVEKITHHSPESWLSNRHLKVVARGQEFVADVGDRADARIWATGLITEHRR